ncbi:putative paraquat-inducible protein A [Povalibacter uvarum]|uniref:High-potential iron-sulfur protein n=1 Tax=Povalibacter uvarum TaxID=732238 RepID=A0A841HP26_9GAMM|nr:high-potential iron-sulfur protein [Povalibacter uvarum]MBB6094010.1 putative paraquat-inducible protein A [Povalibacter uvarum]
MQSLDRRRFLRWGVQLPVATLVAGKAFGACVDPDELSDSLRDMRESLDYADTASNANQACNGCSFFKPTKAGDSCGYCEVLQGPVSSAGHCVSWTKRS